MRTFCESDAVAGRISFFAAEAISPTGSWTDHKTQSVRDAKLRSVAIFVAISIAVLLVDQTTKCLVSNMLAMGAPVSIIPGLLNLTLVHNTGTAFGFFKEARLALIVVTFLYLILLICFFVSWRKKSALWVVSLGLLFGGALGNFADRLFRKAVVDFLDFYIGPYHWYTFNVADSAITVGAFLLGIALLKDHESAIKFNSPSP